MRPTLRRSLFPILLALVAVSASLAQSLSRGFPPPADRPTFDRPALAGTLGITEAQLQSALAGKTLVRTDSRGFQRVLATHGTHGRLITGPALAALVQGEPLPARPSPAAGSGDPSGSRPLPVVPGDPSGSRSPTAGPSDSGDSRSPAARPGGPSRYCAQVDSLARRACLDSLSRARVAETAARRASAAERRDSAAARQDSSPRAEGASAPRALREIEEQRDTVYIGPDGEEVERPSSTDADASASADEVYEERTRGYIGQLFVDMGNGGDWDWGGGDWAVVIYVVVGIIVVGAFVLGGGKALYDLVVNRDEAPVFRELGARFSYSGLAMYGNDGTPLYRDAWLYGLRFAFGVQRDIMSLGLAAEGGSINLSVRGFPGDRNSLDYRGAYLVGGPMVRFGNYHPLAFSLEFLNGTSNHRSIGWISKSRMTLAGKTRQNLLVGAHLGAVFYDLKFTDGLVFRRGDLNRDLSMMLGLDLGYAF